MSFNNNYNLYLRDALSLTLIFNLFKSFLGTTRCLR